MKDVVVLGGPNGAGKTTAARELVPGRLGIKDFVNAYEIARGLSPHEPHRVAIEAGRIMLRRMQALRSEGRSFAFETTCSGRAHLGFLNRCKAEDWRVTLMFLWLPSPGVALDRVQRHVGQGGHGLPEDVVIRRYWAGLANMISMYLPVADIAAIYENSDQKRALIAHKGMGTPLRVLDNARWLAIEKGANDRSDG